MPSKSNRSRPNAHPKLPLAHRVHMAYDPSSSADTVLKSLQDECVQLTYEQYRAKLPWRGDSKYIVVGVRPIIAK